MHSISVSEAARKENNLYFIRSENLRKDNELISKIAASMESKKCVIVFYFDVARYQEIEQYYDNDTVQRITKMFNETLAQGLTELYKKNVCLLATGSLWGNDFIVITEVAEIPTLGSLEHLSSAYRKEISEVMSREFYGITGREMDVNIGYAILRTGTQNVEIEFYKALKRSFDVAKGFINMESVRYLQQFSEIIDKKMLHSVYQPIISIRTAEILGWEALIRGPENSYFQKPENLFVFAENRGMLFTLEKVCRESAFQGLGEMLPEQKVFINVHPHTINDPAFREGETMRLIQHFNLKPKNVVFEITERHHIKDFISFNKTLTHYREQGFLVAVDDVGCGFSTFQSIAEIRPDYVKIDMSLVRGIHKDGVKVAMMESFVTFAEKIGCEIIAEGIEYEAELSSLINIGVHYGQGFFLGKPANPKQHLSEGTQIKTLFHAAKGRHHIMTHAFPIADITEQTISAEENTPVKNIKMIFDENTTISEVIVTEGNKPCGLVMRHHLDKQLGKKYGYALYYEKPIAKIMDKKPLIVDESTSIEVVSQAAMNRNKVKLYDSIIITKNGLLQGIVSVQNLLDTMTKIRLELAKGANPLTGLPGNIAIEQEYYLWTKNKEMFSVIFIDLDNFKSFNDKYGFEKGDAVICFTAKALKNSIDACCPDGGFLGHIGGDDFIIISEDEYVDSLCSFFIDMFDEGIKGLYHPDDREEGGIFSHGRFGKKRWFPFISVSMAVLDCTNESVKDMKDISLKVAQLKQYAKSKPGSVYVRNRRRE